MTKLIKDFFEKLTKKQILILILTPPMALVFDIALRMGLTSIETELEKYNVNYFSITDTLKIDTTLAKRGELDTDTLVDYYVLSKKEINFKTFHVNLKPEGILSIKNKEISKYKLLKNGNLSKEIIEQNDEIKKYYLIEDFIGKGFELNKLELMIYTPSNLLDDSFNIVPSIRQKERGQKIYTRNTNLGNRVLNNEQAEVKKYFNKIKEYKKIKGWWKD